MFKIAHLTDTGLKRMNNEDDYLVIKENDFFLVSDGMGGHEKGEVASRLIVETFKEKFAHYSFERDETIPDTEDDETIPCTEEDSDVTLEDQKIYLEDMLNESIAKSTLKIIDYARKNDIRVRMGATVVGMHKLELTEEIVIFHLGDSRVYRVRDYKIKQLTVDHSKYEEMKQSGEYTEEELSKVGRNSITRAVGNFKAKDLEINYFGLKKDDIFLLCSDGVSDLCSDEELLNNILINKENLDNCCKSIKELVYSRGAKDNLTLIIGRY